MRAWAIVIAFLVLVGTAQATASIEGRITFHQAPTLSGGLVAEAVHAMADLVDEGRAAPVHATFTSLTVREIVRNFSIIDARIESVQIGDPPSVSERRLGAGAIESVSCGPACSAFLLVDRDGQAFIATPWEATLHPTVDAIEHCIHFCDPTATAYFHRMEPGAFDLSGPDPARRAASLRAMGEVRLAVRDAIVTLAMDEGPLVLDARSRETSRVGLLAEVRTLQSRLILLDLHGATVDVGRLPQVAVADPILRLDGELRSPSASGRLHGHAETAAFEASPFLARGALEIQPVRAAPEGDLSETPPMAVLLRGDADAVLIAGAAVPFTTTEPGLAVGVASALLLVATLALRTFAFFYTRIAPGRVLQHPHRASILERLRERPGASGSEIARELGISRVTAQHHLRMLESFGVVRSETVARRTRYFLRHEPTSPELVRASFALHEGSPRILAAAMARADAPSTQQELSATTGMSQRLVSYHLARLVAAGLVSTQGARPQRYALRAGARRLVDGDAASA